LHDANYIARILWQHRNDTAFLGMPTESCYVTLIENAILLCVAYGLLSSYFEDVLQYGFLFFGVFIGLCACYVCTATGFCMMLLDDATSTQLALLDAGRPFTAPPPNNIAHVARILARTATTCSVALLVLFVTVGCEFFTQDSALARDSLPTIALKSNVTEPALATQMAVSTAFAVYFMLVLMLLGSNQQLNGIFLRLQYMTQAVPMAPAQAAAFTTAADDVALFVRVLLALYVVICGCTGTFQEIFFLRSTQTAVGTVLDGMLPRALLLADYVSNISSSMKNAIGGEWRNYVAMVFGAWWLVTDALRCLLPVHWICTLVLTVFDLVQVCINGVLAEVVLRDSSLTNFACLVLLICDATCVFCACLSRFVGGVRTISKSEAQEDVAEIQDAHQTKSAPFGQSKVSSAQSFDKNENVGSDEWKVPVASTDKHTSDAGCCCECRKPHCCCECRRPNTATADATSLHFSGAHVNIDRIKMRVFEKKYI